ncbi:hypothetical protein GGR54DRAFT_581478 [Hypoxylon sp. NC1633]|nr:hypothetical protein GGR54DRAFT_581478 [Hypoxylon sp. NC1633]
MATSTVASVARMAHLILGLASVISVTSADKATTSPMEDLPGYLHDYAMTLSLITDSGPGNVECEIAPLTGTAGLNQTGRNSLRTFHIQGDMVLVDQNNYNSPNIKGNVAYLTCDPTTDDSYITPNDVFNTVMTREPNAILLFSTVGTYCNLGGDNLPFHSIWTMVDHQDAETLRNMTSDTAVVFHATISGNNTVNGEDGQSQGGNNSAVAMSILYSITGLITLLFLIIIGTGAVRAHRHPERYGPRASYGGRPRQSRAKGLARAVLETLPIVKFGDPNPPRPSKPDPENELDSISGDRQQRSASPHEVASNDVEQGDTPPDATAEAAQQAGPEAQAPTTSGENGDNDRQTEDDHLGCSICTEDFSVGQDVRVLPCDHKFHPQCIDPWLVNVSGTCPLCRLDLRPREENEEQGEASTPPAPQPDAAGDDHVDEQLAPPPDDEADASQRRRRSRLLDWNRLRHASVDERIQALRQYRQSQGAGNASTEDQSRHAKLSDRLREKFHIRTRAHPPSDSAAASH